MITPESITILKISFYIEALVVVNRLHLLISFLYFFMARNKYN